MRVWPASTPGRGDDLARVDLSAAELDRFLRVRRRLEPTLREHDRLRRQNAAEGRATQRNPLLASSTISRLYKEWMAAEAVLVRTVVEELAREGMGPKELDSLIALVEWRFLHRGEALIFGLPEYARADLVEARESLRPGPATEGLAGNEEYQTHLARMRAKAADLEQRASAALALSPSTLQLLESRRPDLERLDSSGLTSLMYALDPTLIPVE